MLEWQLARWLLTCDNYRLLLSLYVKRDTLEVCPLVTHLIGVNLLAPNHQPGRLGIESFGAVFDADVDLETLRAAFDNMLDTATDVGEAFACVLACLPLGRMKGHSHDALIWGLVML